MNYIEILEVALSETSTSRKKLAKDLGVSPSAITNVMTQSSRNGISLKTMLSMLDCLGYEIVVQKKTQGRRKEGQMVLTQKEE